MVFSKSRHYLMSPYVNVHQDSSVQHYWIYVTRTHCQYHTLMWEQTNKQQRADNENKIIEQRLLLTKIHWYICIAVHTNRHCRYRKLQLSVSVFGILSCTSPTSEDRKQKTIPNFSVFLMTKRRGLLFLFGEGGTAHETEPHHNTISGVVFDLN